MSGRFHSLRGSTTTAGVRNCALAALFFGASTPAASSLVDDVGPLVLAGLLYLGAALAVAPWCWRQPPSTAALRRDGRPLAVAVVVGGAIGPALLTAGLVGTPAATASLMLNLELVATVVLAATLFREHLGRRLLSAVSLVTLAGVLLVWEPGAAFAPRSLLIVAACACWGLDNSVTSRIDQVSAEHVTLLKGLVAGSANLTLGLVVAGGGGGLTPRNVAIALVIGALGYGVSITLWIRGAHQLGAARGQVIFATAPFIGAVIAWTALDEQATVVQISAAVLAALGVALALRSGHEHSHSHEPLVHTHEHDHDEHHQHDHQHDHDPENAGHDNAAPSGRHTHVHEHNRMVHTHPHVPDLHHRHQH